MRPGRVLSTRSSVPIKLGCHPPHTGMCSLTLMSSEPHAIEIFMETSSHRPDGSVTPFLALLPSPDYCGGRVLLKIPKLVIMIWPYW